MVNWKAAATLLGDLAIAINTVVFSVSWILLHPFWQFNIAYYWIYLGHTIPIVGTLVQLFLLQDAPLYLTDIWILIILPFVYFGITYYFYYS